MNCFLFNQNIKTTTWRETLLTLPKNDYAVNIQRTILKMYLRYNFVIYSNIQSPIFT
jgi:hypothetical protein